MPHTEDTVCHTCRVELVDSIQLFTCTHKLNRFVDYRTDRKSRTTTGVTIQFGQYHTVEVQTFVKFFGCIDGILSCHGVYHEQNFVRIDRFFDSGDLVHHLFVYGQTSGCIDDYEVISFGFGFLNGVLCNLYRIFAVQF